MQFLHGIFTLIATKFRYNSTVTNYKKCITFDDE